MTAEPGPSAPVHNDLPPEQQEAMRRAVWLEGITIAVMLATIAAVYAASGQSQAMKVAWIEDTLSLLPPIAFLVAARIAHRVPAFLTDCTGRWASGTSSPGWRS